MSSLMASLLALVLYAVVVMPLGWAASSRHARSVGMVYAGCVVAFAFWQTGILGGSSLTLTDAVVPAVAQTQEAQCTQVLELLRETGITVDRSDAAAPKLVGTGADRLPPEVRDFVLSCTAMPAE